jgi:hypothetical protein
LRFALKAVVGGFQLGRIASTSQIVTGEHRKTNFVMWDKRRL